MVRASPQLQPQHLGSSFPERLREIAMFFDGTDRVHQTMRRVAEKLESAGLKYAIMGGMAVNAHRYVRTTGDVDFLVRADGLDFIRKLVASGEFRAVEGRSRRFEDPVTNITFHILVTGNYPGNGQPGPIAFPDPATTIENIGSLQVVTLVVLIELKLAAHRYQDFADVVNLIRIQKLDETFAVHLHPSTHRDFTECLEEMRREEEYESRRDADQI
jgi:hypothetical protein